MTGRNLARVALWLIIISVLALLYLPLVPPFLFSIGAGTPVAEGEAWTLKWYGALASNPVLITAAGTSLAVALITAIAATLLALLAAMAVRELRTPRAILMLVLLPLFIPGISMGLATALFLRQFDVAPSLWSICLVHTLWALPFATLIILTAMAGFDPLYLEAAYTAGADRWRAFRDIELPLIRPGVLGAATFSLILSLNETVRTALVQGPLNTVQTYIWSTYLQVGLSPTLHALMSLLILLTVLLLILSRAGRRSPQSASGKISAGSQPTMTSAAPSASS
jgi:ABC-type spermidine/putrescine transport system permease subunit II